MKDLAQIRNDVVGSLLRPAQLKEAHSGFDQGKISQQEPVVAHRQSMTKCRGQPIAIATFPKCAPLSMWENACFAWSNGKILSTTGFIR